MASNNDDNKDLKTTPRPPIENEADVSDPPSTSEFSITNPFENHTTIDSLLHPSFSPSVFNVNGSSETEAHKTTNHFWTIDQIAVLKPTDIDLSTLHNQQDFVRLDPASECQAQQAIDEFFASHIEIPSPWSDQSNNHYIALISPSPAQTKRKANLMTPYNGRPGFSSSSAASSLSSSSQICLRRLQLKNQGKNPPSSTKPISHDLFSFKNILTRSESKNASTQTTLTLPKDFDLKAILSQYYKFGHSSENTCDALNSTSLRRKLFFPDGREVETLNNDGEINMNMLQHLDDIHDLEKFALSPVSLQKIQPACNNLTPLTRSSHCEIPRTPSTCQSHFSSSPLLSGVGFDQNTPCSRTSGFPRFGSGVRRRKMLLGSSGDEDVPKMQLETLASPELSPVEADVLSKMKVQGRMEDICEGSGIVDESMSFRVIDDNKGHRIAPESSHDRLGNLLPSMESSRRQLVLESPPISPIEPIKRKSHDKKSSPIEQVNSTQSLALPQPGRSLYPSPMLSPIPCKNIAKTTKPSTVKVQHNATSVRLSSTVTLPVFAQNIDDSSMRESVGLGQGQGCSVGVSDAKPFQSYQNVQYSIGKDILEGNKENVFPSPAVCSSMLSNEGQNEDVSMVSDETSYNQDMCDDIYMQVEKHSTSVLYCSQGFNSLNPDQTGSKWNFPVTATEQPLFQSSVVKEKSPKKGHGSVANTDPCMGMDPRKPLIVKSCVTGAMDVSVPPIQCNVLNEVTNSKNMAEYQGDSGYSTTQSHHQAT